MNNKIDRSAEAESNQINILEAQDEIDLTVVRIGKYLYENQTLKLYKEAECGSHKSFKSFCEDGIGMAYTTAIAWASLYRWYTIKQGIPMTEVVKMGTSKARVLIGTATKHNWDECKDYAKKTSVAQMKADTKAMKVKKIDQSAHARIKRVKVSTFTFSATDDEISNIQKAISSVHADNPGFHGRGEILNVICSEYLVSKTTSKDSLARIKKLVEGIHRNIVVEFSKR